MKSKLALSGLLALSIFSCQKETPTVTSVVETTPTSSSKEKNINAKYSGSAINPTNMYLTSAGTIHNQLMEDLRSAYPNGINFSTTSVESITYPPTYAYFASFGNIGSASDVATLAYIDDYHYCRHHRPRYLFSKEVFDDEADIILVNINESSYFSNVDKQVLTTLMNAAKTYLSNGNHVQFQSVLTSLKSQLNNGMEETKVDLINNDPLALPGKKSLVILGIVQSALNYQLSLPPLANPLPADPDEIKGVVPSVLGTTYGAIISSLKLQNQGSLKAAGGIINGALQSTTFMELDAF